MEAIVATDFGILGELQVLQDGQPVDLGPPRQRALLARLLIGPAAVTADRLLDDLWAGEPPDSARHVLHVYVSRLRQALGADAARLEHKGSGYRLRAEPAELDAIGSRASSERREPRGPGGSSRSRVNGSARHSSSGEDPAFVRVHGRILRPRRGVPARGAAAGRDGGAGLGGPRAGPDGRARR